MPDKLKPRTDATAPPQMGKRVRRLMVAFSAVIGVYIGGFLWEQVSPLAYSVVFLILASSPLLLKISFWKKLVLLFPLLILRVLGKILAKVFGLKAMEKLFRRYGLLERRYHRVLVGFKETRMSLTARWKALPRSTQAHLILTFLPFLGLLAIGVLVIKLLRFRVLQMVVEKLMQKGVQGHVQKGVLTAAEKIKQRKQAAKMGTEPDGKKDKPS